MHRTTFCVAALLGLTTTLAAQNTFTSPAGLANVDGSSNHDYILFAEYDMRWQQVDHTQVGTPRPNINAIAFRRDAATASDAAWVSRTINNVEIRMAHALRSTYCANPVNQDENFGDAPVLVFSAASVNLPDWTTATGANPEPFGLSFPFTTAWTYNGTDDLLWELRYDSNDQAGSDYGNDYEGPATSGQDTTTGTLIGTGCTATGETSDFDLLGTWATMWNGPVRLNFDATDCPPSTGVIAYLGFTNPNLNLPGLCGTIYSDLALGSLPMGVSDSAGNIEDSYFCVPAIPNLPGNTFYGQAVALDVGQPGIGLALSDGRSWTIDPVPAVTPTATRLYTYLTSSSDTTFTYSGPWYGGIVTQFTY